MRFWRNFVEWLKTHRNDAIIRAFQKKQLLLLKPAAWNAAEGRQSGLALDCIVSACALCAPSGLSAHWAKKRSLRFFKRADYILIAALLILGGALALFLLLTRQGGGTARVQVDGETVMELPLHQDARVVLGEDGNTNTLVIENGTARVIEADCPDQVCVRQGAVQYTGESIVCLPHKLIVSIEGGGSNGVDGSTG